MFKGWKLAAFLLLLVVVMAGAFTTTVSAETPISENDITVNYETETITIANTGDKIIYYTDVYYTDMAKWNACEVRNGEAAFDISWVPDTKNVRLYICGDKNKEVVGVDLVWRETLRVTFIGSLLSADITEAEDWKNAYTGKDYTAQSYPNFSEDTGYLIFTLAENGRNNAYFYLDNIEWRKGSDGVWREFSELDLKEMNIRGIKLEFRVKPSATSTFAAYRDNGSRPSTIASVSIQKLNNAPTVDVNPSMMTVSVRNGLEYSLNKQDWILIPAYNKKLGQEEYKVDAAARADAISKIYTTEKIAKLSVQELLGINQNAEMTAAALKATGKTFDFAMDGTTEVGVKIYVRTAGDEKKAASKVKELVIPFAADGKSVAEDGKIKVYHAESKTRTGGIVAENTSTLKYQIGMLTPAELVDKDGKMLTDAEIDAARANGTIDTLLCVDTAAVKWTNVKEGRLMKFANAKVPEGSRVIYRIAGEEGCLPSTYAISDAISYDVNTYAGISYSGKNVGDILTAVTSTNLTAGTPGISYEWQKCTNITDEKPTWTAIGTGPDYTLTEADANAYIRVVITYAGEKRESAQVGPVKLVK